MRWLLLLLSLFPIEARAEIGIASYYSSKFQGKKTASGTLFNKNKLTAAHKYLKFGTIVRVINLSNDKEVFVTISDRGPYTRGRIIDLSEAAAKKIGIFGNSKVKLIVQNK